MECQKCGEEIKAGKRFCPYCGGENVYDGQERTVAPPKWHAFIKAALDPMWIFMLFCVLVVIVANVNT